VAYQSSKLLTDKKIVGNADDHDELSIESELKRRCFWATWATGHMASESKLEAAYTCLDAVNLPLPGSILRTGTGLEVKLIEKMDRTWTSVRIGNAWGYQDDMSLVLADLMKMIGVW
jgi:hypothetical protein